MSKTRKKPPVTWSDQFWPMAAVGLGVVAVVLWIGVLVWLLVDAVRLAL